MQCRGAERRTELRCSLILQGGSARVEPCLTPPSAAARQASNGALAPLKPAASGVSPVGGGARDGRLTTFNDRLHEVRGRAAPARARRARAPQLWGKLGLREAAR